jgi:hypothetical protein
MHWIENDDKIWKKEGKDKNSNSSSAATITVTTPKNEST